MLTGRKIEEKMGLERTWRRKKNETVQDFLAKNFCMLSLCLFQDECGLIFMSSRLSSLLDIIDI